MAEVVIAKLLEDPGNHTARLQAEHWKRDLEALLAELDDPAE
jgi:hypothetical protein